MQNKQIHNDLEHILHKLNQEHQQAHTTDDIPHIEVNQEYDHERRLYDVEIHIYPKKEPGQRSLPTPLTVSHPSTRSQSQKRRGRSSG